MSIDFSGNIYSNPNTLNRIVFSYEEIKRKENSYLKGVKHNRLSLLNKIEVFTNSLLFKRYEITHEDDIFLGYQRVSKLQEFNGSGEPANPVLFKYDTTNTGVTLAPGSTSAFNDGIPLDNNILMTGDFIGEGKLGFIIHNKVHPNLLDGNADYSINLPFIATKRKTFLGTTLINQKLSQHQLVFNVQEEINQLKIDVFNAKQPETSFNKIIPFDNSGVCEDTCNPPYIDENEQLVQNPNNKCVSPFYNKNSNNYLEGDFNGDGISELLIFSFGESKKFEPYTGNLNLDPISNLDDPEGTSTIPVPIQTCTWHFYKDHLKEVRLIDLNPNSSTEYGSSGNISISNLTLLDGKNKYVGDFNGDGKSDVLVINLDGSYKVVSFMQLTQAPWIELELVGSGFIDEYSVSKQFFLGDFNGDGKTDIMLPNLYGNGCEGSYDCMKWFIYYSNPIPNSSAHMFVKEFQYITDYMPFKQSSDTAQTHINYYFAMDTNKDGKTDLVRIEYWFHDISTGLENAHWVNEYRIRAFANNIGYGSPTYGFTNDFVTGWKDCLPLDIRRMITMVPMVVNIKHKGQGPIYDLLILNCNTNDNLFYKQAHYYLFNKNFVRDNSIKEISQSDGAIVDQIEYATLEKQNTIDTFYNSVSSLNYPYVEIEKVFNSRLVKSYSNTSMGVTKKQYFKYFNMVIRFDGLGILGFNKIAKTSFYIEGTGEKTWNVTENDPTKRGALLKTFTCRAGTFNFLYNYPHISEAFNEYSESLDSNSHKYAILLTKQTTIDLLTGMKNIKDFEYTPDYLLPWKTVSKNYHYNSLEGTTTIITDFDPNAFGTGIDYHIGRPKKTTTTINAYNDTKTTSEELFYTGGNVTRIEKKANNDNVTLVETFTYYNNGNIESKTTSAEGTDALNQVAHRTTQYVYDTTNRYIEKVTNPQGLITTYEIYHPLYGVVLKETNPYNLSTLSVYDNWGKRTQITDYLGKAVTYNYTKSNGIYSTLETVSFGSEGSSSSLIESDALARVIRKGATDVNGNWNYTATEYDTFGRKWRVSEPYAANQSPTLWNVTEYDTYDRPILLKSYTGKNIDISYPGLTVTSYDGMLSKSVTKNSNGHVVLSSDNPGGSIIHYYYADGSLKESIYEGISIKKYYDNWGRVNRIDDPSSGTTKMSYNAYGELLLETREKGKTYIQYDSFGKIIEKRIEDTAVNSNIITEYQYDPTTKLLAQINVEDIIDGNSTYLYQYDNYYRVKKIIETLPEAEFIKEDFYDNFGRVFKEKNSASAHGQTTENEFQHYFKNGYLWKTQDFVTGNVLYQVNEVNTRGQLKEALLGNGITMRSTYDNLGYLTESKHTNAEDDLVMQLNTNFEHATGNLLWRENSLFNYKENFGYDALDRLVSETIDTSTVLVNATFDFDIEGFEYAGGSSGYVTNQNEALKVRLIPEGSNAKKLIYENAVEGQVLSLKADTTLGSLGNAYVSVKIIEVDPITQDILCTEYYPYMSSETFNYTYTVVNNNMNVFLLFQVDDYDTVSNPNILDPSTFISDGNGGMMPPVMFANFTLDNLIVKIVGSLTASQEYDDKGRISSHSAIGNYVYADTVHPFQATEINNLQGPTNDYFAANRDLNVTYNAFNSPIEIEIPDKTRVSFGYNFLEQRSVMYYGSLDVNRTDRPNRRYYSSICDMEIDYSLPTNEVIFTTFVGGDAYTAPVVLKNDGTTASYYYLHRDYQGSILAITDEAAKIVEKRLFDAWGNIIKVQDADGNDLPELMFFDRGYTGHEHIEGTGLINMNARFYDPKVHRFLQADKYIQDPFNSQNYNRYSYCINNPLKYTDITGNMYGVTEAIVIGVAVALVAYFATVIINHQEVTIEGIATTATFAAISSVATFGIGEIATTITSFFVRSSFQALAHGVVQGGLSCAQGGEFWTGFAAGSISSISASAWSGGGTNEWQGLGGKFADSGAGMIAFGTIMGGAGAALTGGNFWQGAVTGLMVSGLNHFGHSVAEKIRINRNANAYLKEAGYNPYEDISNLPETKRLAYIKTLINKVSPSRILYDDIEGNYEIYYSSSQPDNAETSDAIFGTTYGPSAFTTNKKLFLTTIHEGLHLWDISHGLTNSWGLYAKPIMETRAYEMKSWFNGGVLDKTDAYWYDLYKRQAAQSTFDNFTIKHYPTFFNNIQR